MNETDKIRDGQTPLKTPLKVALVHLKKCEFRKKTCDAHSSGYKEQTKKNRKKQGSTELFLNCRWLKNCKKKLIQKWPYYQFWRNLTCDTTLLRVKRDDRLWAIPFVLYFIEIEHNLPKLWHFLFFFLHVPKIADSIVWKNNLAMMLCNIVEDNLLEGTVQKTGVTDFNFWQTKKKMNGTECHSHYYFHKKN